MAHPEIYTAALQTFLDDYPIENYDLRKIAEIDYAFRFLNGGTTKTPAEQFIGWASKALAAYLAGQIKQGTTDFSRFSAQEFLDAFDKLAAAKYESELEEGQKSTRDQYAGADKKAIKNAFNRVVKEFNKPLSTMWKENLKQGKMSIKEMKDITDTAYHFLENSQSEKDAVVEELHQVAAALETMRQIRESRKGFFGWFWKLFNREQNRQEEAYYEELQQHARNLTDEMGYDIEAATKNVTEKTVFGKEVKTAEKEKATERKAKESAKTKASGALKLKPCAEKINNKFYDNDLGKALANELFEKLPAESVDPAWKKSMLERLLLQNAVKEIKGLNEAFDEAVAKGADYKQEMAKLVRGVFKMTVQQGKVHLGGDTWSKAQGYEIMAQVFIDNLTAVSVYPELSPIANEYLKNNVGLYKEIVAEDYVYSEMVDKYAVDYVPTKEIVPPKKEGEIEIDDEEKSFDDDKVSVYEKVFEEKDELFSENNAETSPQVSKPNEPTTEKVFIPGDH